MDENRHGEGLVGMFAITVNEGGGLVYQMAVDKYLGFGYYLCTYFSAVSGGRSSGFVASVKDMVSQEWRIFDDADDFKHAADDAAYRNR